MRFLYVFKGVTFQSLQALMVWSVTSATVARGLLIRRHRNKGVPVKKIALVVFAGLATACGVNNINTSNAKSTAQFPVHRSVGGEDANALFAALENAGVKADTVDGRVIIGAVNLYASTLHCRVIMNATQDASCTVEKDSQKLDVASAGIAKAAANALDTADARVPLAVIGVTHYEATDIECSKAVGPYGTAKCDFNVSLHNSDENASISKKISGDEAETLYKSLESANLKPETVDGQPVYGAVTLKAEMLTCTKSFDANFTKSCALFKDGVRLGEMNSSRFEDLVDLFEKHGAQVGPRLVGANQYAIGEISCQMTVLARPEYKCSFELMR